MTFSPSVPMSAPFIPFADPHAACALRKRAVLKAVRRVFDSGHYILGGEVETFERAFADYLGLDRAVGCACGTDALELSLRVLGVGAGKAVFTVSHTAVATVAAVERAGAVPAPADIDPATLTMDPESLEASVVHLLETRPDLTPAAVIPVHLYGHPCDMDAVTAVARKYALAVVEDCAQAHGARYKGRQVGAFGNLAAFSFYPTKNLGALGDAGAVATRDPGLAEALSAMRQYGWNEQRISVEPGVNSRLDPVQAAVLNVQLKHLDPDNAARRRIAARYAEGLSGCGLLLPAAMPWVEPVFHLYVVRCPEQHAFREFLRDRGIGTAVHYPRPAHLQPAYRGRLPIPPDGLPVTERIMDEVVSLPMFPQLEDEAVDRVIDAVRAWARTRKAKGR
ncbi:MAG: DegT/DnrJ/EryC1/StrS family aminotransferase [Desulfovibrio sp.]|jgi:dTDP-4-amino-4,6-dideoxygalactose transaminase|nr:DegT/DnrJ/EryC1/StrS family aminotransferase [Desulfovibrio sp.]